MNPLFTKLLPYILGLLAASMLGNILLTKFYLSKRDEVAQQIELCNQQKLVAIAGAEKLAREALQAANAKHLEEIAAVRKRGTEAVRLAQRDTRDIEEQRDAAQQALRQLMRDARGNEDATISQICLDVDIVDDALNELR